MGLYKDIADPALHRPEIDPLHPRPPELPRKSQTDTITVLENHMLNSFFHGNQTHAHCLGKTTANHL
eukprot:448185-Ditylum_brightwellii.AAC.1